MRDKWKIQSNGCQSRVKCHAESDERDLNLNRSDSQRKWTKVQFRSRGYILAGNYHSNPTNQSKGFMGSKVPSAGCSCQTDHNNSHVLHEL